MARTYSQLYPNHSIIVLDSDDSVGGVWSTSRMYPGLKTNNLLGSYENPDFAMTTTRFQVAKGHHIPGPAVHDYLEAFAEHFNLKGFIRLLHKVEKVEEHGSNEPGVWTLTVKRPVEPSGLFETVRFTADRLVIAAGVTAYPNLPDLHGVDRFLAPIYHAKDFQQHQDLLKTAKRVVIYGGAKSAWDGVYAYASSGIEVDWVIRESGKGPCWMQPPHAEDGSLFEDALTTRIFSLFQPCPWDQHDGMGWLRWLLHRTFLRRLITQYFWSSHEKMVCRLNGYDRHPETKKLKPWSSFFWAGTSVSILNYPTDIFEYLRQGRVHVHHADIVSLDDHTVALSDGTCLSNIDALHCSTGWKPEPPITFSPPELAQKLGLPSSPSSRNPPLPFSTSTLPAKADAKVLSWFPVLRAQPNITPKRQPQNIETREPARAEPVPYRLYRQAVPPAFWDRRSICITGTFLATGQAVAAQCQALWVAAYLNGELQSQNVTTTPLQIKDVEWETEVETRFHRLRTPASTGDKHGEYTFETVLFYDLLLRDLGLKTRRKETWVKEWSETYGPKDYKGIIDEWDAMIKKRNANRKGIAHGKI